MQFAEQEFDQNVHDALIGLNTDLEQFEIADFLVDHHDSISNLFLLPHNIQTIKSTPDSLKIQLNQTERRVSWSSDQNHGASIILKSNHIQNNDSIKTETIIIQDSENTEVEIKTIIEDKQTGQTYNVVHSENGHNHSHERESNSNSLDEEVNINKNEKRKYEHRIVTKVEFDSAEFTNAFNDKSRKLEDVILKLMIQDQKEISERLNLDSLQQRIQEQLSKQGLNLPFQYMVKENKGGIIKKSGGDSLLLIQSNYQSPLLSSSIQSNLVTLYVQFPSKYSFLVGQIWIVVALSLLFIVLISFAFIRTIQNMNKQRKIADLKNDFVSNMTHELKTPITSINLACETLFDKDFQFEEQQVKNYVKIIAQENERLQLLVNNVLESSFFDSDRMLLNKSKFDISELLQHEVDRFKMIVEKKNGQIKTQLENEGIQFNGDPFHLSNIVHNLLDNAIKYSPDQVNVVLNAKTNEHELILEVVDQGQGIPSNQFTKIFDKFHRVQQGDIHDVKGYGLGLYYTARIVELHEGKIEVKSTEGKGSTFIVRLPINTNSNINNK